MKKLLSLLTLGAVIASVPVISACGTNPADITATSPEQPTGSSTSEDESTVPTETTVVVGGWTVNTETIGNLPSAEKDIFKAAIENTDKSYLTPVACIGGQIVAGKNRAFLCIDTKSQTWHVLTVYCGLDGVTTDIIGEHDLDPLNLSLFDGRDHSQLVGGWSVQKSEAPDMPEDAQDSFDKALKASGSSSFKPVALLATQVVAGVNYRFLCTESTDDNIALYAIDVYSDPSGNAEITRSDEIDLLKYVGAD